ncbi:hypothetical protein CAL29_23865 [Bordetella genomosp. 10]|uniref:Dehydrogenase n=1 Tax=Bordetella genomosp. 10 TaxID=1416804 RepID=A0A261S235_9BORD|nr:hypothetical protein CAL29_23865 [Bordetella genomosp. 10]
METPASGAYVSEHAATQDDPSLPQRRTVILGLVGATLETALLGLPTLLPTAASAQPAPAAAASEGFLALSRALTDRHNLNPVTARRIEAALAGSGVRQAGELPRLVALAAGQADGKSLLAAAANAGLRDLAEDILAAWYTGTVGTGAKAMVVAYQEALMYQPVRDALPVPTYCNFGPLWWKGVPPDPAAVLPEPPALPSSKAL